MRHVYRAIQRHLTAYKDEKRGPTLIAVQSHQDFDHITSAMPVMSDFPMVPIHVSDGYMNSLVFMLVMKVMNQSTLLTGQNFSL